MSISGKQSGGSAGRGRKSSAFTLIELMVSMAILGLIMVMLFAIFEQINKAWLQGENRVETFTQTRAILDLMSRELSQAIATPNIQFFGDTNRLYFVAPVNTVPTNQADLCEVGYEYNPAAFTLTRDFEEPTSANIASSTWIYSPAWWGSGSFGTLALLANVTNILNVSFEYFDPAQNKWVKTYTSNNKLPSAIQISIDTVDSRTAARLGQVQNVGIAWLPITNSTLRTFSSIVYLPNTSP
jgi:prepilin-type N-terminal cleavage/methylation domain-containing protein